MTQRVAISAESPEATQQPRIGKAAATGETQAAAQGNSHFGMSFKEKAPKRGGPTAESAKATGIAEHSRPCVGLSWTSALASRGGRVERRRGDLFPDVGRASAENARGGRENQNSRVAFFSCLEEGAVPVPAIAYPATSRARAEIFVQSVV